MNGSNDLAFVRSSHVRPKTIARRSARSCVTEFVLGQAPSRSKLDHAMDEEVIVWIPTVSICRHERTGEFKLIRWAAEEGFGGSNMVGPLIPVTKEQMAKEGLGTVMECLRSYRMWPAGTLHEPEIGRMDSRTRSKFVRDHQFVDVLQRDKKSINVRPNHHVGRGLRGITGYQHEEVRLKLPVTQEQFNQALNKAFEVAS